MYYKTITSSAAYNMYCTFCERCHKGRWHFPVNLQWGC